MNRSDDCRRAVFESGVAAFVLGVCLCSTAIAGPDGMKDISTNQDARFRRLDANHDGLLSRGEVRHIAGYGQAFDQADASHDGRLDQDEFLMAESFHDRQQAAAYVDDSIITARVKGSLLREMKNLNVSVETTRGRVLLSGFVDDESQVRKASQLASSVEGVQGVRNGLVVR